jgi:hypothetical protein
MARKITPLTIRNFGYGFRKSFLKSRKLFLQIFVRRGIMVLRG